MICQSCGTPLPDGTNFCPNCGARAVVPETAPEAEAPIPELAAQPQPVFEAPAYAAPAYSAENLAAEEAAGSVLTWGILGLIFGILPLHLLGIIFSAISLGKASSCRNDYGYLPSKGKTGRGLGIAGLILSILGILLVVIFIIASIFAAAAMVESGQIPVDFSAIPIG